MPGIINYSLEDFQSSARTYRAELLRLPLLALSGVLQYMTLRPGIRFEEVVGAASVDVDLQPYVRNQKQDSNLDLVLRVLRTHFGSVNYDFEPNAAISTILGHRASSASGAELSTTPQAQEVLALVPKAIGRKLALSIFAAKRDPKGKTTMDLFDGFDTITKKEIDKNEISSAKKNLIDLSAKPDNLNAVEIAHEILSAMSPELREQECLMFVDQDFYDNYCRAYKLETGAAAYNKEYDQVCIEGSQGRVKLVPLAAKAGSKYIHVTPAANMLVGVDQMSDQESVKVGCFEPDTLTVMMRMFFGVQFESIDRRRMLVARIPD